MPEETTVTEETTVSPMRIAGYVALATIATLGARRVVQTANHIRRNRKSPDVDNVTPLSNAA